MKNHCKRAAVGPILIVAMGLTTLGALADDREENQFAAVTIGDRQWMTANLNVSRFRNGDAIPEAKTTEEWTQAGKDGRPAWCYYENDPRNGETYGKLYNWYAVVDPRGLAPEGWRLPDNKEWAQLAERYGGIRKAGAALKSPAGWGRVGVTVPRGLSQFSRHTGEYAQWVNGSGRENGTVPFACSGENSLRDRPVNAYRVGNPTNESGFAGLPGGMRTDCGEFMYVGIYGYWWSSTELNSSYAHYRYMYCRSSSLFRYINYYKSSGFSVRCVRDASSQTSLLDSYAPAAEGEERRLFAVTGHGERPQFSRHKER